jgi:hypothetical protein
MATKNIRIDWNQEGARPTQQYNSAALEAGAQIKATPGMLHSLVAVNTGSSDRYVQVHNAASAPADTAVPMLSLPVEAGKTISFVMPTALDTGIYVCLSTTAGEKTLGSAEALFFAQSS